VPCHNPRDALATRPHRHRRSIDATEGTPIDIIFLVERLESIIANGKRLPLTNNVVVDQTAALGLIDELRVAVPEEVRAAKRINSEGERIIEKAQEEAERIVARAQEQAAFLIDERGLTQQAEAESRRIVAEAEADAEEVRRGADEYAVNVLVGLEGDVVKTLQSIKKGIDLLDTRRTDLRAGDADGIEPDDGLEDEAAVDVEDDEGMAATARR
jgi:F0F1-type ATP synthase membrane subunit b/b'